MKLAIKNFQCHSDLKLEFNSGEHCLVSGESGKGKSTIFRAITWCLYGEGKDVAPSENSKVLTYVYVEFSGLKIYRQHNPNLLTIQIDDKIYEGEPAQSIINTRLGNYQIWKCTTYMTHKYDNPLISARSKDRMKYLDKLSFNIEQPSVYLQNVDEQISLIRKKREALELQVKVNETSFKEYVSRHGLRECEYLTPEQMIFLKQDIDNTNISIGDDSKLMLSLRDKITSRNLLLSQIQKLESQLSSIPVISLEILEEKETQLQRYERYVKIKDELRQIPEILEVPSQYTTEQIETCQEQEYKRRDMEKIALSVGVPYTSNIEEFKKELQLCLEWLEYETAMSEYNKLVSEIDVLRKKIDVQESTLVSLEEKIEIPEIPSKPIITMQEPEYPKYAKYPHPVPPKHIILDRPSPPNLKTIEKPPRPDPLPRPEPINLVEIQKEMQLLLLSKQMLHCPSCNVALRLTQNTLQLASNIPDWNESRYLELQSQIEYYQKELRDIELKEKNQLRLYDEKIRALEENMMREYNMQIEKIKQEESRINTAAKNEYDTLLLEVTTKEKKENDNLLKLYTDEKRKYDNEVRQQQELYHSKMIAYERAKHQEEERCRKYKLISDELVRNKSTIDEYRCRLSKLVVPEVKSKPSIPILKLDDVKKKLTLLENVVWMDPISVSSIKMKESNLLYVKYNERQLLLSELTEIGDIEQVTLSELNTLREHHKKYIQYNDELTKLSIELEKFPDCNEEYNTISVNMNNKVSYVEYMQYIWNRAKLFDEAYRLLQILDNSKLEYQNLQDEMSKHQYFRDLILKLEEQYYQDLIKSINKYLEVNISHLFDIDIRIQLSLSKRLKSGKSKKELHLDITREGMTVSYTSLSDGESARVNLLLTCALNQLSSNGLLIIDETLSCLDAENKHACMKFISKQLSDSIVLIVNHEGNPGDYTRKIDM